MSSPISQPQFQNIMQTLQCANLRHSQLAASISRAGSRPAKKARTRAQALNLTVSVQAASKLDPGQISKIPLPELDLSSRSPSPDVEAHSPPKIQTADHPKIVAPVPRYPSQIKTEQSTHEVTRPTRPKIQCAIPSKRVPYVSKWSASTVGSGGSDDDDDEDDEDDDQSMEFEIPQIGLKFASDNDENNKDIIVSPDEDGDGDDPFAQAGGFPRAPLMTIQIDSAEDVPRSLPDRMPLRSPPGIQEVPGLSHFSSGSESSASFVTPIMSEKLPVRFKRKSFYGESGNEDHDTVAGKRQKHEGRPFASGRGGHKRSASS